MLLVNNIIEACFKMCIRDRWAMAEMSRAMSSTTEVMTNLMMIVAMISLVVGGVGIMNIMLVSCLLYTSIPSIGIDFGGTSIKMGVVKGAEVIAHAP